MIHTAADCIAQAQPSILGPIFAGFVLFLIFGVPEIIDIARYAYADRKTRSRS